MKSLVKKELILEGLGCAHCAAKIEEDVKELEEVSAASMNFITKTLTIETQGSENMEGIMERANAIIKKHEPDIVVVEKRVLKPDRKVLRLKGLDCADCAVKIENEVKKITGIKGASVDFIARKMTLEFSDKQERESIVNEAVRVAKRLEPGLEVAEEQENNIQVDGLDKAELIRLGVGVLFFVGANLLNLGALAGLSLFLISYILIGGEVVLKALRNITKGKVFDENFLMSVATVGAFIIGEFPEAVAVMLFYQIGELFQDVAVNRSRKSIKALMDIRPDYANLKTDKGIIKVSPEDIKPGDWIVVKPGERVPLDGEIKEGQSMMDTSALTGEPVPRQVREGDAVLAGFINKNGLLSIEVTKEFGETTVSKILELVENASSKKAPTENFITRFARFYTPVVVFTALALAVIPPLVVPGAEFSQWIYRALIFLVVSCPCALVISIPLGFFGGIGGASKNGILVKGGNFLEALNNVDTVVFDKTGTLTKGVFKVTHIQGEEGIEEKTLLQYAAMAESYSNHPIALSILKAYGEEIDKNSIEHYEEIPGCGVRVKVKGMEVLAGNARLMKKENILYREVEQVGTAVHLALDKTYAGYIVISDEVKEDAGEALKELRRVGVKKLVMLTGDNRSVADKVGRDLGLDEVHAGLLPHQKVQKLEELERQKPPKGKLVFVGDGVNDAPVLARADIGVAMGGLGSDAAIEAADVVLMTDEPSKIVTAVKIAKRTRVIIWQNIFFALAVKGVVLLLGAGGIATMWEAVFADVGVAVLAILNAMRVMRVEKI
ncbi:MAG: heavy metal translocating P-type ATPase [Clostridia bacterium]|nr:heavy metal translocating P-type ATPase [Clostridia bacterium]